jgi:hypothetical protein
MVEPAAFSATWSCERQLGQVMSTGFILNPAAEVVK